MLTTRKAFSMIELIFVIVIIGILSAIALPRLSATRTDAIMTKAKTQISSIRNGITINKSLNLMKGVAGYPATLDDAELNKDGEELFDGNTSMDKILEYPIISSKLSGGWIKIELNKYTFKIDDTSSLNFEYNNTNGHFDCLKTQKYCTELTK